MSVAGAPKCRPSLGGSRHGGYCVLMTTMKGNRVIDTRVVDVQTWSIAKEKNMNADKFMEYFVRIKPFIQLGRSIIIMDRCSYHLVGSTEYKEVMSMKAVDFWVVFREKYPHTDFLSMRVAKAYYREHAFHSEVFTLANEWGAEVLLSPTSFPQYNAIELGFNLFKGVSRHMEGNENHVDKFNAACNMYKNPNPEQKKQICNVIEKTVDLLLANYE